jgi:hypothetical protein
VIQALGVTVTDAEVAEWPFAALKPYVFASILDAIVA